MIFELMLLSFVLGIVFVVLILWGYDLAKRVLKEIKTIYINKNKTA